MLFPIGGLALLSTGMVSRKKKWFALLLSCMLFSGLIFMSACGGSSSGGGGGGHPGTPAGNLHHYDHGNGSQRIARASDTRDAHGSVKLRKWRGSVRLSPTLNRARRYRSSLRLHTILNPSSCWPSVWPSTLNAPAILPIALVCPEPVRLTPPSARPSCRRLGFPGGRLLLVCLALTCSALFAQNPVTVFGTNSPVVVDSANPNSILLGVRVFSDVPGQVLGCSFYKSPTNLGVHVVSLWDSAGKLLATQTATGETASGKQSVMFSAPVAIAANQTFTCGYSAPGGHWSYDMPAFTTQMNAPPLHVPVNGGLFVYGSVPTQWPTSTSQRNYWVDVIFAPSTAASTTSTWISGAKFSTAGSTANVNWNTAVASDSQVEYGPTAAYGSTSTLDAARVTAHSATLSGLSAGTTYHVRMRSRDSDAVLATGVDYTFATVAAALPVSVSTSPLNVVLISGASQQFTAKVSNATNLAVTWSATTGTINSTGMFTAPTVLAPTVVTVNATSQADTSKSASAALTVNPAAAELAVTPASLSFSGQAGASSPTPASVSITNSGGGSLSFTGASDQTWLVLSAASGKAPSSLGVSPSIAGLKAGSYTGHVTLTGGGTTKTVTVALTVTAPPIQHSVALSWKANTNSHVISYSMYRSTQSGSAYGLAASAIGGVTYSDQSVQSGTTYYYVVTAVDDAGKESVYSNEIKAVVP